MKYTHIISLLIILFIGSLCFTGCQNKNKVSNTSTFGVVKDFKLIEEIKNVQNNLKKENENLDKKNKTIQEHKSSSSLIITQIRTDANNISDKTKQIKEKLVGLRNKMTNIRNTIAEANIPQCSKNLFISDINFVENGYKDVQISSFNIDGQMENLKKELIKIKEEDAILLKTITEQDLQSKINFSATNQEIINIQKEVVIVTGLIDSLEKEKNSILLDNQEAIAKQKAETAKMLNWLIFMCAIAAGVSVAIGFLGNVKIGIGGFIAATVTLVLAVTLSQQIVLIAWIGAGVLALVFLLFVGNTVYHSLIYKKAFAEQVQTVEVVKQKIDQSTKDKIFGVKGTLTTQDSKGRTLQSSTTQKLIQSEKEKLGKLWNFMKEQNSKNSA